MNQIYGGTRNVSPHVAGAGDIRPPVVGSARSERALAELWPVFTEEVLARLYTGARTYGDGSFSRTPEELCAEILQELDDVMGWGFILWCRVREMMEGVEARGDGEPPPE